MITLRQASEADYEPVMQLYGEFTKDPHRFAGFDNDSYKNVIKNPNARIFVACEGDIIVAFISCTMRSVVRYPKPIVEIEELFVSPEYRRQKIGNKLVEKVISFSREKNCMYVFVSSAIKLHESHTFYKALSFEEYEIRFRKKL